METGGVSSNPKDYVFQKNAFVEKLRPLTYYEAVTGKTLMVPIPNSKYVFHSKLQSITALLRFHQIDKVLLQPIERIFKGIVERDSKDIDASALIKNTAYMIRVMWELAIKPKNLISRFFMWRAFNKACIGDCIYLFNLKRDFLEFNSRVFFLMKYLLDYNLHQTHKWRQMVYSPSLVEDAATRIRRRGLSFNPSTKLRKQAESANTN